MLELDDVHAYYGKSHILQGISFRDGQGDIAGDSSVILLDEPTAGMSRREAESAVELIRSVSQGRTLVIVEHDMGVVFDLADRISVLVYGAIIATDVPERIRENADVQTAYLGTATHA